MVRVNRAEAIKKQFSGIATRWVEETRVVRMTDLPDHVYHYTDAAGLHGMLSNHLIWLTDHRFLNDKTEAAYTKTLVQEILRNIKTDDAVVRAFVDRMMLLSDIRSNDDSFVFSLSQAADDLSQWRGYAREGQGFTLGFDAAVLHENGRPDDSEYSFVKVDYEETRQQAALERMLRDFIAKLSGMRLDPAKDREIVNLVADQADWAVENKALLNKHQSFISEQEWRIVAHCSPKEEGIRVRVSGLRLVPYYALKPQAGAGDRLPITSIGIGPGFDNPEVVADAVKTLARVNGYDPVIYFADTPYRRVA